MNPKPQLGRIAVFVGVVAVALIYTGTADTDAQRRRGGRESAPSWVENFEPHIYMGMPYRLMQPIHFDANKHYPVIVFLHGGWGRGTDNRRQIVPSGVLVPPRRSDIFEMLNADSLLVYAKSVAEQLATEQRRSDYPSYVLAPQTNRGWRAAELQKIKDIVVSLPSVDMDRIYVIGHSMGGHGIHTFIQTDPAYFAAVAPSAGTGLPRTEDFIDPVLIKDIPIWAFHGDQDTRAPIKRGRELFAEMKKLGGNMKLTLWVGDGHGVSTKMIPGSDNGSTRFSNDRCDPEPDLLKWLFKQKLSDRQ
jgi:predicted peptidase